MSEPPIPPPRRSSIASPPAVAGPSTGPIIPTRSSSTRQKQPWRQIDAKRSRAELEKDIESVTDEISHKTKKLKPATSYESDFWTTNADISLLCQQRAGMESRLHFLIYKEDSQIDVSEEDWSEKEEARNLWRQIQAYRQAEDIARKQASRLEQSRSGLSSLFFKLFTTSPQGLNINNAGPGGRPTSQQSNMRQQMRHAYCPDAPDGEIWDPISGQWELDSYITAAHLYAWRQVEYMDEIFGPDSKKDIFSPSNGLFLTSNIEKALDNGYIAIVPDVDMEPKDRDFAHDDLQERNQRLRDWERTSVKEYKVVVLDKNAREVKKENKWRDKNGQHKTLDKLDGRRLEFRTDFRPRARYVWWTFMNALLQTSWRQTKSGKKGQNVIQDEVAKATRYWGTRGRYVKKNLLRGFVDELGQDIESILENAIDDNETGDPDPGAVAVMASETVFRMQEAAKGEEGENEDKD